MQIQNSFSIEQPVPCQPKVADYSVLLNDMSIIRYDCVYKKQLKTLAEFQHGSGLTKIKRDDILVELFQSRRSRRSNLKIVFPDIDIGLFLDTVEIKIHEDVSGYAFPVIDSTNAQKNQTLSDWNFIINEFLQEPLEYVFKITGLLDRLNFTINKNNTLVLVLQYCDNVVRDFDQEIQRVHGYCLMDVVMSFAGIHPIRPDLFYPEELCVLK